MTVFTCVTVLGGWVAVVEVATTVVAVAWVVRLTCATVRLSVRGELPAASPTSGNAVVLERDAGDGWHEVARTRTDADGRARELSAAAAPGRFRLRFDTAGYLGADAFFPEVVVQFAVHEVEQRLHVPLLLSQFGYSTYRGS